MHNTTADGVEVVRVIHIQNECSVTNDMMMFFCEYHFASLLFCPKCADKQVLLRSSILLPSELPLRPKQTEDNSVSISAQGM